MTQNIPDELPPKERGGFVQLIFLAFPDNLAHVGWADEVASLLSSFRRQGIADLLQNLFLETLVAI